MAVLLVAVGCDGIDLEQLVKQHPPLTRFAEEPAGANCPHGGHSVRTGLDVDEDGTLADTEVTTTEYVCASALPGVLVRRQSIPPGAQCPHGGQLFRAGHDLNGNDELEDSEVTREVIGCTEPEAVITRVRALPPEQDFCEVAGHAVEAGPDLDRDGVLDDSERRAQVFSCEDASAIRLHQIEEPTTTACPAGSTRVDVGTDRDGDGTFESDEVAMSMFVCRPLQTFDGTYTVRNAADLAALQGISRIRGMLEVIATSLTEVDLPHLMVVEATIVIRGNPALKSVQLRGLRFVDRDLLVHGNPLLETLVAGSHEEALWLGSHLTVEDNARLSTLAGLSTIIPDRGVTVGDNPLLEVAGSFDRVYELRGNVTLRNNPRLLALPFTSLEQVGGTLEILNNDALTSIAGMPLKTVGGDLRIEGNDVLGDLFGLSELTSINGRLDVRENAALHSMNGLQELTRAGAISIVGNPNLGAAGDFLSLQTLEQELYIGGNDKLAFLGTLGTFRHTGSLIIMANPLLKSLSGLEHVRSLGLLHIHNSNGLTSLAALSGLQDLEELRVTFNGYLAKLDLDGLTRVTRAFKVVENPRLPTCWATTLAARTFPGQPDITRNDSTATCD